MQGYVLHLHTLPCLLMQWYARICFAFTYVAIPADAYLLNGCALNGYVLVGYALNFHIVWIRIEGIRIGEIRIDRIRVEWIRIEKYVWDDAYWYAWCGICQQSSEEPCDETSFGKNIVKYSVFHFHQFCVKTFLRHVEKTVWIPWGDILGSGFCGAGKLTISCPTKTVIQVPTHNLHIPFPCPYLVPGSIAGFAKPNNTVSQCEYSLVIHSLQRIAPPRNRSPLAVTCKLSSTWMTI